MLPDYKHFIELEKINESIRGTSAQLHGSLGSISMILNQVHDCIYVSKHHITQEFIPPETYKIYGEKSLWFIDVRVRWTADALTEYFNTKVVLNNWHEKGQFQYRGFRPPACTIGAILSQHRFGRGADCDITGISPDAVRKEIISKPSEPAFRYITCIEDKVNWLHFDCRDTNEEKLLIVQP